MGNLSGQRFADRLVSSVILASVLVLSACNDPGTPPSVPRTAWRVFKNANSPLLNNRIHYLLNASDATMWIATDSGASSFRGGNWGFLKDSLTYVQFGALKDTRRISAIVEAKDKSIWFCLPGGGVTRYDTHPHGVPLLRYTEPDLISDVVLSGAAETSGETQFGELWFATPHGISRFVQTSDHDGRWSSYSRSDSGQHVSAIPADNVLSVARNLYEPSFWFGTENGIVTVRDGPGGLAWTPVELPSFGVNVNALAFDLSNTVWIGRDAGGVFAHDLDSSKWLSYANHTAGGRLPDGPVKVITTDLLRKRWFGTEAGLVELSDTTWTTFTTANSPLPSDTVLALSYDARGNLWIGTANGLAVYNDQGVVL